MAVKLQTIKDDLQNKEQDNLNSISKLKEILISKNEYIRKIELEFTEIKIKKEELQMDLSRLKEELKLRNKMFSDLQTKEQKLDQNLQNEVKEKLKLKEKIEEVKVKYVQVKEKIEEVKGKFVEQEKEYFESLQQQKEKCESIEKQVIFKQKNFSSRQCY
jgi:chromosome segregation ATPase